VEFGCSLKDNALRFYVADTGSGIDPALQDTVFQRFQQVHTDRTSVSSGMGLGLPIAKSFVELLGGRIWLESNPGTGTVAFFTIEWSPLEQSGQPVAKPGQDNGNGKHTILVAEDEENNFELLKVILESVDMEILHAWDGKQALELLGKHPEVDLVLMDIKMPVMGGYEATQRIKEERPELPVVALTAYALPGDREKALSAGCDDYMAKPVSLKEFLSIVKKHL